VVRDRPFFRPWLRGGVADDLFGIAVLAIDVMAAFTQMIAAGMFETYPRLKCTVLEAGSNWIASWLDRLDHKYEVLAARMPFKDKPSTYFYRQCIISADPDESLTAQMVEHLGEDYFIWASDYPHIDASFGVVHELRERLAGLPAPSRCVEAGEQVAHTEHLVASYGQVPALQGISTSIARGEIVALMGRNGAGKSTLLKALVGMKRPASGSVVVDGQVPAQVRPRQLLRHVGLVPQVPGDLLYAPTVGAECAQADADSGVPAGTTRELFERLSPGVPDEQHPRDLSEGQRLTLALAIVLAAKPPLLLLDEPTRGLDYTAKHRLVEIVRDLAAGGAVGAAGAPGGGHAVLLATHDVELVAEVATRVLVIADGELVADGPTVDVVVSSPAFAPQVAKVLAPQPWLTPTEVAVALADEQVAR
jgi:energy-coupling factor transporter ATP-binding protein EcfA2